MVNLTTLMGAEWLTGVLAATPIKAHPIQYMLLQRGVAWDRWRITFDLAIGIVCRLVAGDPVRRAQLVAKLQDRRQFWATVPEVIWAARLDRLGFAVTVEPILGRRGPDLRIDVDGFSAHAEVYSPMFEAAEFDWGGDLHAALEDLGNGFHISAQRLPERRSQHLAIVRKALRRVLHDLRAQDDRRTYRFYLWPGPEHRLELQPTYETLELDSVFAERVDKPLFVADVQFGPGLGGVTVGTHVDDHQPGRQNLISRLGQLRAGANVLIVDASRDFVSAGTLERECFRAGGPFERRPELSAVIVSAWGVYATYGLGDDTFGEDYAVIENQNASDPFPPGLLRAMTRPNLLP